MFFILLKKGEAVAFSDNTSNKIPELNYQKGSYFGELALLKDQPWVANVKAKTDVKLLNKNRSLYYPKLLSQNLETTSIIKFNDFKNDGLNNDYLTTEHSETKDKSTEEKDKLKVWKINFEYWFTYCW